MLHSIAAASRLDGVSRRWAAPCGLPSAAWQQWSDTDYEGALVVGRKPTRREELAGFGGGLL